MHGTCIEMKNPIICTLKQIGYNEGQQMKEDEMDWAGITNCRKLEIHKKN